MNIKNTYTDITIPGYERVIYCENESVGLRSYISIHNTKRGPSLGGCRMWKYNTQQEALTDVLRLSKGMTYKSTLADLSLGGGKSVIWADENTEKNVSLLETMAEFVHYLDGRYIIAEDIGISAEDIKKIRQFTPFTVNPIAGDPGPTTALGVFTGIKAACKYKFNVDTLNDINIVVEGAGSVGYNLIKLMSKEGANISVFDINKNKLNDVVDEFGVTPLSSNEEVYTNQYDVYSPCALGAVINDNTIGKLKCKIVSGAANNQLLSEIHGQQLKDKNILYSPDYVINAGGVILVSGENGPTEFDYDIVKRNITKIGTTLTKIFEESDKTGIATNIIADKMAEEILNGKKET